MELGEYLKQFDNTCAQHFGNSLFEVWSSSAVRLDMQRFSVASMDRSQDMFSLV